MTKSSQDLDHRLCPVLSIDDDDATEDTVAIEAKGAWKTQPTEIRLQWKSHEAPPEPEWAAHSPAEHSLCEQRKAC